MDPNTLVLDISSDEDADWNDHGTGGCDGGDDYNWFAELFGEGNNKERNRDDSDGVVVVSESEKPVKKSKLKSDLVELDDDCVILDSDPNESVEVCGDNRADDGDDSDEILVVSQKGQVACRDYPHSRHLCIKFPFSSTPNQTHCNQCYCYVCDSLAPCVYWGNGTASTDHCHATDKDKYWILERKNAKNGGKIVRPVTQPPPVDLHTPAPALAQPQNLTPNPGRTYAQHASANFQYPNIPGQYGNNILASRSKLHPDLTSQFMIRAHQKYSPGSRVNRPVFKRTGSVRVATTANQNPYSSHRGGFGNISRQQNYPVNGTLSKSSRSLGPVQLNAVKTSMQYPSQSPTVTSLTVNPQPLLLQPQVPNPNPSYQSPVNSNSFPETMHYQQLHQVPSLPFRPQPASSQLSYTVPAQPNYPVSSKTSVAVSDFTHKSSQGNQAHSLIVDSGFKDCESGWVAAQDSATNECTVSTNNSSLAAVSGGLADYQYDWIFDDQPIEPGFIDYSSDSAFIDTGPIFDF